MAGYLIALALTLPPAAGNFAGELLAEVFRVPARTLSPALHAAAGIVLAVVGTELMPEALAAARPWAILLAFVAGGGSPSWSVRPIELDYLEVNDAACARARHRPVVGPDLVRHIITW